MNLLSKMKISARLNLGFIIVLALTAIMTTIGLWRLNTVADATVIMTQTAHTERLANKWLRGIEVNATRTIGAAKVLDDENKQYFLDAIAKQSSQISDIQNELEVRITNDHGKKLLAEVAEKRKAYIDIRNNVFKAQKEGTDYVTSKMLVDDQLIPALNKYIESVELIVAFQNQLLTQASNRVAEIEASSRSVMLALGAVALVIGLFLSVILSRSIIKPLNDAVAVAKTVAAGDLTSKFKATGNDETGELLRALKDMNGNLHSMVSKVLQSTGSIATASGQIAAGNLDLSARTEQQAASLAKTASSVDELTSTVKQNADNAKQADQLAASASEIATKGGAAVSEVVHTMDGITDSSKKIVEIISVIDGIAFQTNILALNAAVEAARAGEQGRGFAVVASEVRNLAQRSAAAAKEIKTLINDSVEKVGTGSKLVEQAGATIGNVVTSIKRVSDIVAEIAAASQEQSEGIEQVNQAISEMDQVTQQNAALVEEAAAATESLQDQATTLSNLVNTFKIGDTGS